MTGTPTPRSRSFRSISGTAAAAASLLTVTRTSSLPACARRATWIAVASASAVSVFVIDWTTTGCSLPTGTPPTSTVTVLLRCGLLMAGACLRGRAQAGDVESGDPQNKRHQEYEADGIGEPFGAKADPGPEQPLEDEHCHAPPVERWEGQDVHDCEVDGQDAGDVEQDEGPGGEQ